MKKSDDSDAGSRFISEYMQWNYDPTMWLCLVRSAFPVSWGKRLPVKGKNLGSFSLWFYLKTEPHCSDSHPGLVLSHLPLVSLLLWKLCGTLKYSPAFLNDFVSGVVTVPEVFPDKWLQLYLDNPASLGLSFNIMAKTFQIHVMVPHQNLTLGLNCFTI